MKLLFSNTMKVIRNINLLAKKMIKVFVYIGKKAPYNGNDCYLFEYANKRKTF